MIYTGNKQPDGSTPTMNVSPFGEWRWSPMGLAGRDPIFYAQLDSEIAFVKSFFKDDPVKVAEKSSHQQYLLQVSWRHGQAAAGR